MIHKSVINDEFNSAIEFIEKGGISNFCHAILSLQSIVEFALNDFFNTYIHTFSQEDLEKIKKRENKNNKKFDDLELGRKMGFLRDFEFIEKAGENQKRHFANTLKLRDSDFVETRNEAIHRLIQTSFNDEKYKELILKINTDIEDSKNTDDDKCLNKKSICVIDRDNTIKQYDLIADVLNELGFEGNYDYQTTRYNIFCDYFQTINDEYVKESTLPFSDNYAIDNNLLSDFESFNYLTRKYETFYFISNLTSTTSECLTECNCLIYGEGGIGKSTILHHIYEYCRNYNKTFLRKPFDKNAGHEDFCPIPIFIAAHKFKIPEDDDYDETALKADISRQLGNPFSFFKEAAKMANLYNGTKNKPFFIFLIDGLNETSYANNYSGENILNILGKFIEISENRIQIIITSRTSLQPDEKYQSSFKQIRAQGLTRENIIKYVEMKNPIFKTDIISKLSKDDQTLDILKNPMLLTLYMGYKYDDEELKKFGEDVGKLKDESKIILREAKSICISDIFWNYIQYKVLFHNIFQPVIEMQAKQLNEREKKGLKKKKSEQELYRKVISELIPQIAWELVSRDLFSIKISDDRIIKIMENFSENYVNNPLLEKEEAITSIIEYMTNSVCLLKCEDEILSFHHQNFRDFFAACYYINEYMLLTGSWEKKTDKIRNKLRNEYLSSNVKLFVGELLNEREAYLPDSRIDMPLKEILSEYKHREETEDLFDHTVENIFEIDKTLDVLNPIDYFDLNIDRLNFSDVKADKMVSFVDQMLNNVSIDELMSEGVHNKIKKKLSIKYDSDTRTVDMLHKLLMLSARCASNSDKEYLKKYFDIWFTWAKKLYKNKTDIPAKKLTNKAIFNYVLKKDMIIFLASGPLTNLLHSYLEGENIGTGEKGILSVFNDISNSKPTYMSLTNVLKDPVNVNVSEIVDKTYDLASEGGLASNFIVLILDYYIFENRENKFGIELINELIKRMNEEKNEEKKTYVRFRLMSGINFCLQESLLDSTFTKKDLENFKSIFKPIMTNLLTDELNSFSDKTADDYRDFKYGYYFPFGIIYTFDNGINEEFDIYKNENLAVSKIFKKIFSTEPINYKLFQKLIFDVACFSTSSFFVQNLEYLEDEANSKLLFGCNYLENTYYLFKELIYKLYPIDKTSPTYENNDITWISLIEAMSILYYNFPLKTEAFFDSINAHYLKNGKVGADFRILRLKRESANTVNKKFEQLCQAKLRGNTFIIKDFITNYKNTWLFAALPNNIYINFEIVREAFVNWAETSFYKNIDEYNSEPKKFVEQTLKEVLSILD